MKKEESQGIPILDFRDYQSTDLSRRAQFVADLQRAYQEIGFVGVRGHEVAGKLVDELYAAAWGFVALGDTEKRQYHRPELFGQRGYTPKGQEHAKGASVGDLKEFYHVGQELEAGLMARLGYPANVWPREVPEFQGSALAVFRALESLGHGMLSAILDGLGLNYSSIIGQVEHGNSILRVAHYFPIADAKSVPPGAVRAAAHGDINLITLLVGASADGLELQRRDGSWLPVVVDSDTIVVNVGDMLERLSNGRLRSTIHRVVNPPEEKLNEARISMPFFMHPKAGMDLSVLDQCIDSDHPKRYANISAGEFLEQRLREIGLK